MKWRFRLYSVLIMALAMCFSGPTANASSDYDDLIVPVKSAVIGGTTNCPATNDISINWEALLRNSSLPYQGSSSDRSGFLSGLDNALADVAGWDYSIVQVEHYSPDAGSAVKVYVSAGSTATFKTYSNYQGDHKYLSVDNTMTSMIYIDDSGCNTKLAFNSSFGSDRVLAQHEDLSFCYGGFCDEHQPVFVSNPVTQPTGYAGKPIPAKLPASKYVALGDSYSSGEGAFDYYTASGGCHRSQDSYPAYLQIANSLGDIAFAACAGAVTDDLYNQNPVNTSEIAQREHLGSRTEVVTLTIGGNDIDFAGIMDKCITKGALNVSGDNCRVDSTITTDLADRLDALAGNTEGTTKDNREIHSIKEVLVAIAAAAPNAKIYIAGYPRLFGGSTGNYTQDSNSPGGYKCDVHTLGNASVSYSDAQWLNDKAEELNDVIEGAVISTPSVNATYVPTTEFFNHGLCDNSSSYILSAFIDTNGDVSSESFHPNVTGMDNGYAAVFSELID